MNCAEYRRQISDLVSRGEPIDDSRELVWHLRECELCRRFYEDSLLSRALRQTPDAEPDSEFADRVIEKALNYHRRERKKWVFTGFSAAAALMVAVFAAYVISLNGLHLNGQSSDEEIVAMSAEEEKTINILIEAKQSRKAATFTIDLDGDIELTGMPGSRNIEWQTDLTQGKNLLELPVKAQKASGGQMKISYRYNGVEKEVRILVRPRDKDSTKNKAKIQQT